MTIIDVSRWQGMIDWPQVVTGGVTTAVIRATMGATGRDPRYAENWLGASAAKVPHMGIYHLVTTTDPAALQATNILITTGKHFGNEPITLDCERTATERLAMAGGWQFPKGAYTIMLRDLLDRLAPHAPLRIYTSAVEWAAITTQPAWGRDYLHWLAQYNDHITAPDCPPGWTWDWWQYTATGTVPGIAGDVDMSREKVVTPLPVLDTAIAAHATAIIGLVA